MTIPLEHWFMVLLNMLKVDSFVSKDNSFDLARIIFSKKWLSHPYNLIVFMPSTRSEIRFKRLSEIQNVLDLKFAINFPIK